MRASREVPAAFRYLRARQRRETNVSAEGLLEIIASQALCKLPEALQSERFLDFALAFQKIKKSFKASFGMAQARIDGDRAAVRVEIHILDFEMIIGFPNWVEFQS